MRPTAAALFAIATAALVAAQPAAAQPGDVHGLTLPFLETRPLDTRVALADAAVIGTVDVVELGRIRIGDAIAAFGDVPPSFELKRAPSSPPGLVRGERVLLLLRGARSPYLLVDEASEIVRATDAEARWLGAVRAARAAGDDPDAVLTLALSWLDAPERDLRQTALRTLVEREGSRPSRAADLAGGAARAAVDDAIDWDARMVGAVVASRHAETRRDLLAQLPGSVDPRVIQAALRTAFPYGEPGTEAALLRSLRHDERDVRLAALGVAGAAGSTEVGAEMERIARDDPDPAVRSAAQQNLERAAAAEKAAGASR